MNLTNISQDDVFLAYKKLKHHFYFDNANLLEKKKIADFEELLFNKNFEIDITGIKTKIFEHLENYLNNNYFFQTKESREILQDSVKILEFPKSLIVEKSDIISNKPNFQDNFEIDRTSKFADFPIEIHIISVLWIMFSGKYLEEDISKASYANTLDREFLNEDAKPSDNLKLFKPYFIQYQLWRDTAIEKAESLLTEKRDVTILSLDLKDFYHSVRINLETTFEKIGSKAIHAKESENNIKKILFLNDLMLQIHKVYRSVSSVERNMANSDFSLPVGLISSGILSNYYLSELDERIISNVNPAFYGRYVDDLMLVFSDIKDCELKKQNSKLLTFLNRYFVKKSILRFDIDSYSPQLKNLFFKYDSYIEDQNNEIVSFINTKFGDLSNDSSLSTQYLVDNFKFKVQKNHDERIVSFNYDQLELQSNKVVIHFLSHKESRAIINIFKRKLDNQRSEFRFLPDEDEISEKFDEEAFELKYNDSINKFRSISDFSENKYGASKFLAKIIFAKSYGNNDIDTETDQQILTFFKGEAALRYFSLWEKVATYFIISNRFDCLIKFKNNVHIAIKNISFPDYPEKSKNLTSLLINYFETSVAIPLALNPYINDGNTRINKENLIFYKDCITLAFKLRRSNMFRHSLMAIPASHLTYIVLTNLSLLEKDFNYYDSVNLGNKSNNILTKFNIRLFSICNRLTYLLPNYIQFHEVNNLRIIDVVSNYNYENDIKSFYNESICICEDEEALEKNPEIIFNKIPDDSFSIYQFVNYSWKRNYKGINSKAFNKLKKKYFEIDELITNEKQTAFQISIKGEKIKDDRLGSIDKNIAIANIKVQKENMFRSLQNNSNVDKTRRKTIFKMLNDADKHNADLIVFPEVCIPYSWIRLLSERSHKRQLGIVSGLEHWVNKHKIVFNFLATILPFRINHYNTSLIRLRLKNHYSHSEIQLIEGYRLKTPNKSKIQFKPTYDLFHWRQTYFSVYNCFELADIYHRSLFKSKVDFIVASEYNRDTSYFSDIAGAWVRDIHSYFVQVNSSDFGDSRILQPSKSYEKDIVQIKGGINSVTIIDKLKIKALRDFQYKEYHLQKSDIDNGLTTLKPTPPDFDRDNVEIRIKNKKFKA